jgi:asparagine N-glycosylation enzyme membrane subunit Stt3
MNANQRTALYVLAGAVAAALTVWDVLSADEAAALVSVAGGLIGVVAAFVAVRHVTPDEEPPAVDVPDPEA